MSPDLDFLIFQSCSKKARSQKSRVSKELKTFKAIQRVQIPSKVNIQKVNVCSMSFKIQRLSISKSI